MEAIEKIVEQLNQQADLEQRQLKEKETARIDQDFQAELTEMKADHLKRLEKNLQNLENNYKQAKNRRQVAQKQMILNGKLVNEGTAGVCSQCIKENAITGEFGFCSGRKISDCFYK